MDRDKACLKWMFYRCPKKDSWIVAKHLNEILKDTNYYPSTRYNETTGIKPVLDLKLDDILYIHSVYMTDTWLICVLETNDAFYMIDNRKKNNKIDSKTIRYRSLAELVSNIEPSQAEVLGLKSIANMSEELDEMKMDENSNGDIGSKVYPFEYGQLEDRRYNELMNRQVRFTGGDLDLSWNFSVTSEVLNAWIPDIEVKSITFNSCYQIHNFKWLDSAWAQNLNKITFVNMALITNDNLGFIVNKLNVLKQLAVHYCPQINIRMLIEVLKSKSLEVLILEDPKMVCQPNQYGGLITETEWDMIINVSLKKLLITSDTLSLDIIDYLRNSCQKLDMLIIAHDKYENLKKNVFVDKTTDNDDMKNENKLVIASTNGVKLDLPRNFILKNLMRHRFQTPFSNAMMKIMEKIHQE